jgi:signal transduction histidine kinase
MSYVTILWSTVAAAALLLALWHSLAWIMDRGVKANLAFAIVALSVIGIVWAETGMMHSRTPEEWGWWVRWYHVPNYVLIVGTLVFVRLQLGTGRPWLFWTVIALRSAILVANFALEPNFNFTRIDAIERVPFLGEQVTVLARAVTSPWQWIATTTTLLSVVFLFDASVSLWRRGDRDARRKALVLGGAILFFFVTAIIYTQLVVWGVLHWPTLNAPPFLITLVAMGFELSRDTMRASRLARDLRDSERSLELAATAAGLGLWSWDAQDKQLWATQRAHAMFGSPGAGAARVDQVIAKIHREDLPRLQDALHAAISNGGEQEVHFRLSDPDGPVRWLLARGRMQVDARGRLSSLRGVLRDITEQQRAQEEAEELRRELAHAGRVTALGQLASSIAHELSQPLGAILRNVEAAEMLLQSPNPDLQELRDIVADIHRDDRRAGQVIERLRALLKRRQMEFQPVAIDTLMQDVTSLVRSDAVARGVELQFDASRGLPAVRGDKVHLSQVLINLIVNAMDALADCPASRRHVALRAHAGTPGWVEISVTDSGPGISSEAMTKIFEPFFTTKTAGMGMGLSVSRTIVEAHGGRLSAENLAEYGARFHFRLPALQGGGE